MQNPQWLGDLAADLARLEVDHHGTRGVFGQPSGPAVIVIAGIR